MWGMTAKPEPEPGPEPQPAKTEYAGDHELAHAPTKDPYVEAIMEVAGRLEAVEDYLRRDQSATPASPPPQSKQSRWPLWLLALGELLLLGLILKGH